MKHRAILRAAMLVLTLVSPVAAGCAQTTGAPPATPVAAKVLSATETRAPTATLLPPTPTPVPFEGLEEWDVVVISDSSLWGVAEPYGRLVEQDLGVKVTVHDNWSGGLEAATILKALRGDSGGSLTRAKWPQLVGEGAEVLVLWGNPMDSVAFDAGQDLDICLTADFRAAFRQPEYCSVAAFEPFKADLEAIYDEIARLRQGRPLILIATDIYNPVISAWREQGIDEACRICWEAMSGAARQAAEEHGVPFVSRYDDLNGPNHDKDPRSKGFIREDGEHPSEAGALYMAELLLASGFAYAELPGP